MKLIGFSLNKIHIEKSPKKLEGNLNLNQKMDISSVEEAKSDVFKFKEEALVFKFVFAIEYTPDYALLELTGSVILSLDSKLSKDILKSWKDKTLPEEFKLGLFNIILKKCTLKALQLEEELNLPLHLPLPSFKKPEKKED